MTIREYFDAQIATATADEIDEIFDEMDTLYHCMEDDFDDFTMWAVENGIDLDAKNEDGDLILTLWAWDMCGD